MTEGDQAVLDELIAAVARGPLKLPDLQTWVQAFGGYNKIPAAAWVAWEELYAEHRRRRSEHAE